MATDVVNWHSQVVSNSNNMITCAAVINCKGRAVKVLAFCYVVYESKIIPVALMNGSPIIVLTETWGPGAMRREELSPPDIR